MVLRSLTGMLQEVEGVDSKVPPEEAGEELKDQAGGKRAVRSEKDLKTQERERRILEELKLFRKYDRCVQLRKSTPRRRVG
jgi:hypothetical protein